MIDVVLLLGPTASGKSQAALSLLGSKAADIVSVDSCQVYKYLNIGSAKPTHEELEAVPHHMIDVCDPASVYNVNRYVKDAADVIEKIHGSQRMPVMVGGTIMYAHSFVSGLSPIPPISSDVRQIAYKTIEDHGLEHVWAKLSSIDVHFLKTVHPNDAQRIQRAYEVFLETGKPISVYWEEKKITPYNFHTVLIMPDDRWELLASVKHRLAVMMRSGFIDEVAVLHRRGDLSLDLPSMRSVGYRQIWQYLEGDLEKSELNDAIVQATMRYIKHQCTWLKKWQNALFCKDSETASVELEKILDRLHR